MSELVGGERIAITAQHRRVHVFERTMSTERQRELLAAAVPHIDPWRLITPMSGKQRARIDSAAPLPAVNPSAPLAEQLDATSQTVRGRRWREQVNTRTSTAKTVRAEGDTAIEYYDLGYGIPRVRTTKLWPILDQLALNDVPAVDAAQLSALITRPRRR